MWKYGHKLCYGPTKVCEWLDKHPQCDPISVTCISDTVDEYIIFYRTLKDEYERAIAKVEELPHDIDPGFSIPSPVYTVSDTGYTPEFDEGSPAKLVPAFN